ncbi:MAG: DUF87 domain-containing protein, partial [bacterium]|nr:DUF87 domain-containing protein [bacterium]
MADNVKLIPKKTKVQTQFYKNLTLTDAIIAFVFLLLAALVLLSSYTLKIKLILGAVVGFSFVILFLRVGPETRVYQSLGDFAKYLFGVKKFKKMNVNSPKSVNSLMPYAAIDDDGVIDYKEYYASVIEMFPVEFYMIAPSRQQAYCSAIDHAIKSIAAEQVIELVKVSRPMVLDNYIQNEEQKAKNIINNIDNGSAKESEAIPRIEIIDARVNALIASNVDSANNIIKNHYYLVLFSNNRKSLKSTMNMIINTIEGETSGVLACNLLNQKEVAVFLKNTYTSEFDEREVEKLDPKEYLDWIMPEKLEFGTLKQTIDDTNYTTYLLADYPITVPLAWGRSFFGMDGTKVVVKMKPVPQMEAERRLDKSIMEMEIQAAKRGKASTELEKYTHLETLRELLVSLKQGNEMLFDTNIFITAKEDVKKAVRTQILRSGFRYSDMFGRQRECFINGNISKRNTLKKFERGINSSTLGAMFPFVSDTVQDPKGFFLGYNSEAVFIDFFKRDKERINSNMVIIGKSGSGKSYATKAVLTHLASDNTKIFVLDPEREYDKLARNLQGKVVDVGSAKEGRINPLQVITGLEDEDSEGQNVSLASHLQFLEAFFKMILDGITKDALELLNECIKELYDKFNITNTTDIADMTPEQFPIMQDLYDYVSEQYENARDDYMRNNLKIIKTYLNRFASGGRNSLLWNGYSTITAEENFIVFNFQTLLANNNNDIANAQMLLIVRWLMNEIIKNKDFNDKYYPGNGNPDARRIIVVIDEAHVFIDPRKDTALDFMYQLAKRIRKYNGMQIVITQNLKDFTGTPDIARKSQAIINASQYSMIFALAPHDINDLIALYQNAGQITESEQDIIVSNPLGHAFFMTGPYSRTRIEIVVTKN